MTEIMRSVASLLGLHLSHGEPEYCWFCRVYRRDNVPATRLYRGTKQRGEKYGAAACEACGNEQSPRDWVRLV